MTTTIANLGIKVTSEGVEKTEKALDKLSVTSTKSEKAIDRMIESIKKQNMILNSGKAAYTEYAMTALGASKAETKLATDITKATESIRDARKKEAAQLKANIAETKAANKDRLKAINEVEKAEKKRRDSVNKTIMKLRDEAAALGKSDRDLLKYKMTLAGATAAEKKQALALQKTIKEFKAANQAVKTHDSALMGLAKSISAVALAYAAIRAIKEFGRSLIETAIMADTYKYSLQAVSDTNEEAAESYAYLKSESERLGLSITGQADSFTGFAASAKAAKLTVDETRSSYTGLNEAMTAMHRTPEQMSAGLMALEQMLGKGVVQSEELKRQLANALPGAVPMFADALGLSVSALKDLMKNGLVPAKEAVMIFTDYMSYKFAAKAEDASNSVQASFNKMYNSLYELREAIVNSIGDEGTGIISDFTAEIRSMTEALSSPQNQEAMAGMARSLSEIARAAIAAGRGLAWIVDNTFTPLTTMQQGLDLIDAGLLNSEKFFKATQEERRELIKNATTVQDQYIGKVFETTEAERKITKEIVEENKARFAALIAKKTEEKQLEKTKKALERLIASTRKQSIETGKTNAEVMRMRALELGATELQAQAIYDEVTATDAKKEAIRELSDKMKEIQSAEDKRQATIDGVIQKLKDEIATYGDGKEATASYVLEQNKATNAEKAIASSLGATIDGLKAKTAAQKEYDSVMGKVSPDKVEINRERAILAVNTAMSTGAILNTEYAKSLKLVNDYYNKIEETAADKKLKEIGKELDALTDFEGTTFGDDMADGINNAMIAMNDLMDVFDDNEKAQKKLIELQKELSTGKGSPEERAEKLKDINEYETAMIKNQISGYRELFGTTSQMFEENTRERKALHNAEMAFAAVEIAMNAQKAVSLGVVAVINAMSAGDPYTAVARGLAVAATVAAALAQIGGTFSMGGGSGGSSSTYPGVTQSTGTVLGDITAESESVTKTLELMEDIHASEYAELKAIDDGIQDLNRNITGLVSGIVRGFGNFSAGSLGVSESSGQNALADTSDKLFSGVQDSMEALGMSFIDPLTRVVTEFAGEISNFVLGGLFGKTSVSLESAGFQIGETVIGDVIDGIDVAIQQYQTIKVKKKSWFSSSKKYKTVLDDVDASIQDLFNDVFVSLGQSMVNLQESLGTDNLADILGYGFEIGQIDLKDKTGEEITQEINAVISTLSDQMIEDLFGELIRQYQKLDEGLFETAVRLAAEKEITLEILDKTNQAFVGSTLEAVKFSQTLLDLAGGIDSLSESFTTYYDKFFTDEEKQADISNMLTRSLSNIEIDLPDTRSLYREMVEGFDLTTESGQRAYTTMLELSETSDEYYSYLEELEDKRFELAKDRQSLEIQIMELEGHAIGALALQRKIELDAIDESLRPLQERVWILQEENEQITIRKNLESQWATLVGDTISLREADIEGMNESNVAFYDLIAAQNALVEASNKATAAAAEAETAASTAKSNYISGLQEELNLLEGNLETARSNYIAGLQSELSALEGNLESAKSAYVSKLEDELSILEGNLDVAKSDYIDMLTEEATAQEGLVESIGSAIDSIRAYRDTLFSITEEPATQLETLLSKRNVLAGSVAGGDTESVGELVDISGQYLDVAAETSKTSLDYKREVLKTNILMAAVEDSLGKQLTEAEQQAAAFNELISGVDGVNETLITMAQAESAYQEAKTALDLNWYSAELEKFEEDKSALTLRFEYYKAKQDLDTNWYQSELDQFGKEDTIEALRTAYYDAKAELDNNWYSEELEALGAIDSSLSELRSAYQTAAAASAAADRAKAAADAAVVAGTTAEVPEPNVSSDPVIEVPTVVDPTPDVWNGMEVRAWYEDHGRGLQRGNDLAFGDDPDQIDLEGFKYWTESGLTGQALIDTMNKAALYNAPAYANGGTHPGGLALIGEKGPELSYRPPSQIMSNSDMMGALSNVEVVAELKQLREELSRANFAIAKNTLDTAKTLDKFDNNGLPAVRDDEAA